MTPASKVFLSILLVALLGFGGYLIRRELHTPQSERELMDREIELMQAGRYDKAIQVIQSWLKNPRRDPSLDGQRYDEVAIAYIGKARRDLGGKEESLRQAQLSLEKELALYDAETPTSLRLDLFEIGRGFEIVGDLAGKDKCSLYAKAADILERQLPLIKGESYTAYGKTMPLEPVRRDVRKHLDAVNQKSANTGCPITHETGENAKHSADQ